MRGYVIDRESLFREERIAKRIFCRLGWAGSFGKHSHEPLCTSLPPGASFEAKSPIKRWWRQRSTKTSPIFDYLEAQLPPEGFRFGELSIADIALAGVFRNAALSRFASTPPAGRRRPPSWSACSTCRASRSSGRSRS